MRTHNTVRSERWEFQQALRLEILARKSLRHLHTETRKNCIVAPPPDVLQRIFHYNWSVWGDWQSRTVFLDFRDLYFYDVHQIDELPLQRCL